MCHPLDGVPAASAFNQSGAIAVRLSEVVEHLRSDTGTRVDSTVRTTARWTGEPPQRVPCDVGFRLVERVTRIELA